MTRLFMGHLPMVLVATIVMATSTGRCRGGLSDEEDVPVVKLHTEQDLHLASEADIKD